MLVNILHILSNFIKIEIIIGFKKYGCLEYAFLLFCGGTLSLKF
jgi:hypothetical protein